MSATVDPATAPGAAAMLGRGASAVARALLPVLVVVGVIVVLWYAAAMMMNRAWTLDQIERRGLEMTATEIVVDTLIQERPVLPAPHQVVGELWATTMGEPILRERRGEYRPNPRSLFFHAWQTLAPTMLGFAIGTLAGILLAVGIVHNRAMDLSVMPWAIASQTIPILAIAPMIIVVLNSIGLEGLIPKSLISAYLSFFPVVVGMVKGLRSPGAMDLDLLRTYSASGTETFWKLRLPASVPFLFASLKVGIAAALVGTIVAELPTGARFGLGARLLTGSYYGQTIQIWSALFMAAICAAALVGILGLIERLVLKRMGFAR
ncbi:Pyrimidine ABC transporter, transmembrane component 1 [Roseibacterium elongatum DSM 19469]|uniref:Pyrimidine ABC transporter, transmembrane component 1 n=2 Tax=Roseicyclus elongatus TaxID=159346 RepID=W8RWD8_9RHOB|nr:Pyrimidine ABC transporter, transmembrane component 1 [Roseibacterium elongatum DSM 19469]